MGREWYFNWGGIKSSKKGGMKSGGGRGGGEKKSAPSPQVATVAAAAATSAGCMNAVLHMFDSHHFQFCLHPHNGCFVPDDPTIPKGVEAPRNSLESITGEEKNHDSLHIPQMDIKIKTNRKDMGLKLVHAPRAKAEDISSESSYSPAAARTPTLVARLMGLDILPESNSSTPRSSSSHYSHTPHMTTPTTPTRTRKTRTKPTYNNDVPGPKSLLETPRSSSSHRRKSSDHVVEHRLSLQINKENSIVKEMESSRPSCSAINTKRREGRNYEDENKSPGYYARQIMKQVRETVSRRVGVDITNTVSQTEHRRDEHLLLSTTPTKTTPKKGKKDATLSSLLSTSPKLNKINSQAAKSQLLPTTVVKPKTNPIQIQNKKPQQCCGDASETMEMNKFGNGAKSSLRVALKSYDSIRNKKEEQFVRPTRCHSNSDKKCKKTPLSTELVHAPVPSIVPLKKDCTSLQAPTKLLHKQETSSKAQISKPISNTISTNTCTSTTTTRLSRSSRQWSNDRVVPREATHTPAVQETKKDSGSSTSCSTSTSFSELQYISRILKRTGIDRDTPISFTTWFSPSHPLDPQIYHDIEAAHYLPIISANHSPSQNNPNLSINRKLLFHLVDEMLAHILKPYSKVKPWSFGSLIQDHHHYHHHQQLNGFQLVKTLCTKIRSFPSADCQTLQDIDALVEKDLPRFGSGIELIGVEEEGEAIVAEIERHIMESLVQEMAVLCLGGRTSSMQRKACW